MYISKKDIKRRHKKIIQANKLKPLKCARYENGFGVKKKSLGPVPIICIILERSWENFLFFSVSLNEFGDICSEKDYQMAIKSFQPLIETSSILEKAAKMKPNKLKTFWETWARAKLDEKLESFLLVLIHSSVLLRYHFIIMSVYSIEAMILSSTPHPLFINWKIIFKLIDVDFQYLLRIFIVSDEVSA